jgi:hypothetical protein
MNAIILSMKTTSTSIIAYVGNGVVRGSIVLHEKGKKPIVLSARKIDLKYNENRERVQLEDQILIEFDNLMKTIKTEDFPKLHNAKCEKPDTALVVLSSPWYLSETNEIKMQEANPFVVTESIINKATSNIIKAYKGEKDNVTVLEQNFLSVIVNGYNIVNPIGKKVKDIDINVFTSYTRAESVKRIEDIISSNFHLSNIHIHSQSLVSFSAISDLYPNVKDYTVVDITSELTEILIVKENILRDTASFPLGRYFLMESVAKAMGCAEDMAESLIESCITGKLDMDKGQRVSAVIQATEKEWLVSFSAVLKKITQNGVLPKDFYLFVKRDVAKIFKQFIENEEYQQFALTDGKFEVKIMELADMSPLCEIDMEANINQELDISIVTGVLFNNKKLFA